MVTSDTTGTILTCTATSSGGGTTFKSVTIKRDTTAPTLSPTVSPDPVARDSSATATSNATDATSGVASESCDPVDTSSIGPGSVTCTATDLAGNTATADASYTVVNPDSTAPVIMPSVIGTIGTNDWYTSDVSVSWTVTRFRVRHRQQRRLRRHYHHQRHDRNNADLHSNEWGWDGIPVSHDHA